MSGTARRPSPSSLESELDLYRHVVLPAAWWVVVAAIVVPGVVERRPAQAELAATAAPIVERPDGAAASHGLPALRDTAVPGASRAAATGAASEPAAGGDARGTAA